MSETASSKACDGMPNVVKDLGLRQICLVTLEASVIKTMRSENQAIHGTLAALQEMFQENLDRKIWTGKAQGEYKGECRVKGPGKH